MEENGNHIIVFSYSYRPDFEKEVRKRERAFERSLKRVEEANKQISKLNEERALKGETMVPPRPFPKLTLPKPQTYVAILSNHAQLDELPGNPKRFPVIYSKTSNLPAKYISRLAWEIWANYDSENNVTSVKSKLYLASDSGKVEMIMPASRIETAFSFYSKASLQAFAEQYDRMLTRNLIGVRTKTVVGFENAQAIVHTYTPEHQLLAYRLTDLVNTFMSAMIQEFAQQKEF